MFCTARRFAAFTAVLLPSLLLAQPDRITTRIDRAQTVLLRGHISPNARAEFDQGAVESTFPLNGITLRLKPSSTQQSGLDQLLADQQDPTSPSYHQWLTPEQYADRFGASVADIAKVTAWLQSEGFSVDQTARGRNYIVFSGTAAQANTAFRTSLHRYNVRGEAHFANATDLSIPAALADIVLGVRGLNDFRMKPRSVKMNPLMTTRGQHQIAPDDLATIYDIAPLYKAGVDGTGQKLVVVGQTSIRTTDITNFRTTFNLPAINLTQVLVPGSTNPGISSGDLGEADLDIEWAGAVARNANIIFVYSSDVMTSLTYAVDQNLAPVISMSYGNCEGLDFIDLPTTRATAQQANAQGMTWIAAAGDGGAADCEDTNAAVAQTGLAVDVPSSIPEVTGMGGTEFVEGSGNYWSSTNTANGASALSYIPEKVWNDTLTNGSLASGGGGVSLYFSRPGWQTGPGVPTDSFRHVPDLSMASSANHDGFYVYTGGSAGYFGGTSVAAPSMAGIVTLLNQYLVSTGAQSQPGLGNINPQLYRMAASTSGVFHDVTSGDNKIPCNSGSPDCSGGFVGYAAGPGYDQASGLGSPDAYNLAHAWSSQAPLSSSVVPSVDQNPVFKLKSTDANGHNWAFVLTFSEEAGIATTLTGLTMNGQNVDIGSAFGTATIPARGSISSKNLGLTTLTVPANVVFAFNGVDASGQTWSQTFSVPFADVEAPVVVNGVSNAASGQQVYAPGMILSVYGTQFASQALIATATPLPSYLGGFEADINGVSTPIYYVSANQVNLQIPYETANGTATLTLGNPYLNGTYKFQVGSAAPGIFVSNGFVSPPFNTAKRGQTTTIYITGDGQVRPALATGSSPAAGTSTARLPKSILAVSVTVAGENAVIQFNGIPAGLVGVTQINFTVPTDAPLGAQPVVVTVGGVASPAAQLTITQ